MNRLSWWRIKRGAGNLGCLLIHRYMWGDWRRYIGWGHRHRCLRCGREW